MPAVLKKSRPRRDAGVTLIEILIVIAITGLLSGALVPTVVRYMDDSRIVRARSDCESIRTAVLNFYKDTGRWPDTSGNNANLVSNLRTLYSQGTRGSGGTGSTWGGNGQSSRMNDHLVVNNPGNNDYATTGPAAWKGPYLSLDQSDPWGRAYEINIEAAYTQTGGQNSALFCLSTGLNGAFDTTFLQAGSSAAAGGDDIVVRIR